MTQFKKEEFTWDGEYLMYRGNWDGAKLMMDVDPDAHPLLRLAPILVHPCRPAWQIP